jgi:DNA polymerase-4
MARDDRPVESSRVAKSIGHEETFARDLFDTSELLSEVVRLSDAVASRLREGQLAARTLTLKVRFATFETVTRSVTLGEPVLTAAAVVRALDPLLRGVDTSRGIRLVGVHASHFAEAVEQLSLLDLVQPESGSTEPSARDWVDAAHAIDAIRHRFGASAIGPASAANARGLRLVRKQWGPDHAHP